ncbi:MAG: hypothetical protein WCC06_04405 [Candidatus Aminicenantales bacterium]
MKKSNYLVFLLFFIFISCTSNDFLKLKLEIPRAPAVDLGPFKEIIVTNFHLEKEAEDFDLNQVLTNYFAEEFRHKFKGIITLKTISWEKEESLRNQEFWRQLSPDSKAALFLTGKAEFSQEIRKALVKKTKGEIDGPFAPEKSWAEQKTCSLKLSLRLVNAATGETLLQKDYQETVHNPNIKHPAHFAIYDLMKTIKLKFFREIFNEEKIQQRYLLVK